MANRRNVDRDGESFYPTPAYLIEQFLQYEDPPGVVWDPCCGDGAILKVCEAEGYTTIGEDLFDRGYGTSGRDFLKARRSRGSILTNPPFHLMNEFIIKALDLGGYCAFLATFNYLGSKGRYTSIFSVRPPQRVYILSDRPSLAKPKVKNGKMKQTKALDYLWLVWDPRTKKQDTIIRWLPPYAK